MDEGHMMKKRAAVKKLLFRYSPFSIRTMARIARQKPHPLWLKDPEFMEAFAQIKHEVLQDKPRLYTLFLLTKHAARLDGNVAEAGVYRGGTAKLILLTLSRHAPGKTLHLFDTFCGIPRGDSEIDPHVLGGEMGDTSEDIVRSFLGAGASYRIHKGLFKDTLAEVSDKKFCLVHVDADAYESTLQCCEFFYDRMVTGSVLVFDDYGFSLPGVKRAVDDFFSGRAEVPVYLSSGQCIVIKL